MRKTIFIKNALILSVTGVALRFAGIFFKVKAAELLGGKGLGIYLLAFSVFTLLEGTVTSGISLSVTRLVSEQIHKEKAQSVLRLCVFISLCISLFFSLIVFVFSGPLSVLLLKDEGSVLCLKALCFVLPFCAVSACFKGYFLGRENVLPNSISIIAEQTVRLAFTFAFIEKAAQISVYHGAALIFAGSALGEAFSAFLLFLFYKSDIKRLKNGLITQIKTKDVLHIAFPVSATRFCNSVLRTVENMLLPVLLAKSAGYDAAINAYGILKGMALPLLLFPSSLLSTLSTLLIPEMSKALSCKRNYVIKAAITKCLNITFFVGIVSGVLFFAFGNYLGMLFYKEEQAGLYIRLLSPLVPLMYSDSVADGILKGLDCQKTLFKTYITDSVLRIVLILIFLSSKGMPAFIIIMYISNVLTFSLNLKKMLEFCRVK